MSFVSALRTQLHAHQLDAALAAGADPSSAPELARRAHRLRSPAFRSALATGLENAVRFPSAGRHTRQYLPSAAVHSPASIAQVVAPAVAALAADLRAADDARPQGMAQALLLVTDGNSALYCGESAEQAVRAVDQIRSAL